MQGLRTHIRTKYAGFLIIESNPDAPNPPKPYATIQFITSLLPEGIMDNETAEEIASADSNFDKDIKYTRFSNDEMTVSFNIYGSNADQSVIIGLLAQEWLLYAGYDYLHNKGIVIVDVMELQNRDTYVVDAWERRQGFDVMIRVLSKINKIVPTIETADIERT